MQIINNYRDNPALRRSFNKLAGETFDLDFEDWYQNGFWGDDYNPYSIISDGQVVANVSVNITDMLFEGSVKHFLQLGTVMTDREYRRRGYIRALMERIEADYEGKVDGIYLFANDNVLDFYPKFGFRKSREYQYFARSSGTGSWEALPKPEGDGGFRRVDMDCPAAWQELERAMERNVFQGRLDLAGNRGLLFFYVTKFMRENVYCHAPSDTWVIAEHKYETEELLLHSVFSSTLTELPEVLGLFGENMPQVTLGFTPAKGERFAATELREEDCTLFIKGDALEILEQEKLRIPTLAHA